MRVEQLTCHIGAELSGVNLADAVHDEGCSPRSVPSCSGTGCCFCASRI
ncbi:hypothetical protein ACTFBV_16260 [Aeromonas rivipollensis]